DELRAVQRRDDQKHGIREMRPRLVELQLVHHELFVERGQRHLLTDRPQVVVAALEKFLVGQDGERCGTVLVIGRGDREGIEILAEDPFSGRGFLVFRAQQLLLHYRTCRWTYRSSERLVEADVLRPIAV